MKNLLMLLFCSVFIFGCTEEKIENSLENPFRLEVSNDSYKTIETTTDLKEFVLSHLDGELALSSISSCWIEYVEDANFHMIRVKGIGLENKMAHNIAIPLIGNLEADTRNFAIMSLSSCTHNCSVEIMGGCSSSCDLVVHETCVRQSCSCKAGGSGGCRGGISF